MQQDIFSGNVSAYDSSLFKGIFGTEEMRNIFTDKAYIARCIDAEVALARAESELGLIPVGAGEAIASNCTVHGLDWTSLKEQTEIVGYPILPLIRQLDKMCDQAKFLHFGATTQDIMDSAAALQIKAGLDIIEKQIDTLRAGLRKLAVQYRDTPMAGRTHLQHALPVTFGYKIAVYLSALDRHAERLAGVRARSSFVQFGGAAGSLASIASTNGCEMAIRVRSRMASLLGLRDPPISWHVTRDGIAEAVSFLSLVGGSLGKMALDFMIMSSNEFGEIQEPFVPHRGASSTMPQKRNPISCEAILACSKLLRGHASLAQDAMITDFERASGPWHLEWVCVPEAFVVCSSALHQTIFVVDGLVVDVQRMRQNMDMTKGLIVGEAVMMGLAPRIGRNPAHDVVYAACTRSYENGGTSLFDELKDDLGVQKGMSTAELAALCDPANYLGACGLMTDNVVSASARLDKTRRTRGTNGTSNGYPSHNGVAVNVNGHHC